MVPHLRSSIPFIGQALGFNRDPVRLLSEGHRRFGEIFSFTLFGKQVYALIGPRGNEAFFRAADDVLGARDAYRFTVPIFGPGVAYDVEPELMDEQLRLLHPALRDDRMQRYAAIMAEESDAFLDGWGEAGEIYLLPALHQPPLIITLPCPCRVAFHCRLFVIYARLYHHI